jgi:hypothetical protein
MACMRAIVLALCLGACRFDGGGTAAHDDDPAVDAQSPDATAPAPDAMVPPPPPPPPAPDAGTTSWGCNWDQICTSDEQSWCSDCTGGGGFVCDFDQVCEQGEDPYCVDCL